MKDQVKFPLTIFFDGSCRVCTAGMAHYQERNPQGRFRFIDVSTPSFDPTPYGRSRQEFMHHLHVQDARGRFYFGVDGFIALWQAFPALSRYRLQGFLLALPGLHLLARAGYWTFARLRRYLPGVQPPCDEGCTLGHNRSVRHEE